MINRLFRKAFRIFYRYQQHYEGPTFYELKDRVVSFLEITERWCNALIPLVAFLSFGVFIYDAGFNAFYSIAPDLYSKWAFLLTGSSILLSIGFLLDLRHSRNRRTRIFNLIIIALVILLETFVSTLSTNTLTENEYITIKLSLYAGTMIFFVTEASQVIRLIYRQGVNPSLLFVASFAALILIGALLLLLPNATNGRISAVDAWFTSSSAVCVTGLTVVDTATKFTHIGKLIILGLIQIGGLGIMTFAGILSYLTAGSVSFKNQLALKDMLSSDKIGGVISFVARIVTVTFFFEAIGAMAIYYSVEASQFENPLERVFFSIFHAVSAFCNAGFSTYTNGLYELPVRFNYSMHLVICLLIILGGMGFPIVFNLFTRIRFAVMKPASKLLRIPFNERRVHFLDVTAKLALITTVFLLFFGFVAYYVFEQDASLKQHPTVAGKIMTSFFGAVTPRTAGFNTVDMTTLSLPTVMVYLLLMWIGASPGSTGGGIKTTAIAVAFLNLKSIATGKDRTEFSNVQIGENSVRKAFAIIMLSLLILGVTVLLLSINEQGKPLMALAFEAFSAFATVGLTLGLTPELSTASKILLSFVMLIGRVGMLTILFALVAPARQAYYRFPREEVSL
jgi:trk system potassium uptake protein